MGKKDDFNDDLINVSGESEKFKEHPDLQDIYKKKTEEDGVPPPDAFAPPPPKAKIFHQDDSPKSGETQKWKEPYRPPHDTGVHQDTNYRSPVEPKRELTGWRKFVNHPLTITLAVLAAIWYYTTHSGLSWLALVFVVFVIAPYWFISRRRYGHYYYDDGYIFDDFTHRGCLFRPFRWF